MPQFINPSAYNIGYQNAIFPVIPRALTNELHPETAAPYDDVI
jgi:hypothetical protein